MERRILIATLILTCAIENVAACTNYSRASACSIHASAKLIFIGTVIAATSQLSGSDKDSDRLSVVRFRVDEGFKGTNPGEDLTVLAQLRGNCCGTLPEFALGAQFLLFTLWGDKTPIVRPCDPVFPIAEASDHIAYLRDLAAHRVPTEAYGSVYLVDHLLGDDPPSNKPLANIRITFKSDAGTLDAISDNEGEFRRNLPPGAYEVGADVPHYFDREGTTGFTLTPESCVEMSVVLRPNATIEGHVWADHGDPAANAAITLFEAQTNKAVNFTTAGEDARYILEGIGPGDYVLGVNEGPLPDHDKPYAPIFYPSAVHRESAGIVHVDPGQKIQLADIITSRDQCSIVVRVVDARGKPVSGATLAAQVFDRDYFYTLSDPDVVKNGSATVPAWGHDQIQIYASLADQVGVIQSEPRWVSLCPKKPLTLTLKRKYP